MKITFNAEQTEEAGWALMLREINRSVEEGATLSEWEEGFVVSMQDRLQRGRNLNRREDRKLEEVWKKVQGHE
jgi:hypothetical protein